MVWGGLVQSGATLYGTTRDGGTNGDGTIFSVNVDGSGFKKLHNFSATNSPDGYRPYAAMLLLGDTLYGTAAAGGDTNVTPLAGGIVFALNTNGTGYQVIHTFSIAEGQFPHGRLVSDGVTLYGTTLGAGSTGWGALFSVGTNGLGFTVLHTFSAPTPANGTGVNADGDQPWGGMVLAGDTLYGTASEAGQSASGVVFSISTNGDNYSVMHSFSATGFDSVFGLTNSDGAIAIGGLAISGDTLYGTTRNGGLQGGGTIFSIATNGNNFAVLHSFTTNSLDGRGPWSELLVGGSTLFGTTERGGIANRGTVFSLGTNGNNFTLLRGFTNGFEPSSPVSGLLLSGNTLFGTSSLGGSVNGGTVFSLSLPLPVITGIQISGTSLNLNATTGIAGQYALLTSADVTLPFSQWTPLVTNTVNGPGAFSFTLSNAISPAATRGFYVLRSTR